jgi:predicted nucleotidyltransferase
MINIEEKLKNILEKYNVSLGYLFGSFAKGTFGPMSDIDVAVIFPFNEKNIDEKEQAIKDDIKDLLKIEKVDLINLSKNTNVALGHQILFTSKPLVVKDSQLKFKLESKYLHEFEDMKYLFSHQFSILKNKINVAN